MRYYAIADTAGLVEVLTPLGGSFEAARAELESHIRSAEENNVQAGGVILDQAMRIAYEPMPSSWKIYGGS